jgi:hypothetical protein
MRRLLALVLVCWAGGALAQIPNKILLTSQVVCAASATLIDGVRNRHAITVKVPTGGAVTYIGAAGVNASTGLGIDPGAAMTLQPFSGALYCVGSSQSVQVIQTLP